MECGCVLTAILGAIVMYCVYLLTTLNANYWKKRGVRYVPSAPLFGIMFDIILQRKGLTQILNEIYKKLDGERFGGYLQFTTPVLMVRDLELINSVFVKDFSHFEDRGPEWPKEATDLFSINISTLSGDRWRTARHKLTPTFTSGKLKMMFNAIDHCTNEIVAHINENLSEEFDAKDVSFKYLLNTIASVAFGLKINTLGVDKNSDFYKESSQFFKPSLTFMLKLTIATFLPKVKNFFNISLTEKGVDEYFRKLTKDIIEHRESTGTRRDDFLQLMLDQRRKEKEQIKNGRVSTDNEIINDDIDDLDDKELLDQLKNMPESNENWNNATEIFTDDFIAAHTFVFISAGSETTATILNFVLFELANNQECQKRVQQEISDVLATSEFNYQAVRKMTYLDQFINESMRCNPLGGAAFRVCTRDYKIPQTDIIIEKGTFLSIPIAGLQKDPQYFAEPEKFDPDRFADMDAIPKGAYFGFGIGPRMCIAKRLALLEMKIYIAKLLMNFDIVLSKKTKLPLKPVKKAVLLTVEGGIWVKFLKRQV